MTVHLVECPADGQRVAVTDRGKVIGRCACDDQAQAAFDRLGLTNPDRELVPAQLEEAV